MNIQETIARINELYRIQKLIGLSEEQRIEQAELRQIYLTAIKSSLRTQLDHIEIVDEEPKL
ncbi:MAG: DUF896 domain-containing protein [Paenibacillaceae bacterium]